MGAQALPAQRNTRRAVAKLAGHSCSGVPRGGPTRAHSRRAGSAQAVHQVAQRGRVVQVHAGERLRIAERTYRDAPSPLRGALSERPPERVFDQRPQRRAIGRRTLLRFRQQVIVEPDRRSHSIKAYRSGIKLLGEITDTLHKPYFVDRLGERTIEDALARTAKAEFIVTGDKDLLDHIDLQPPAINARNACELLGVIERN